MYANNIGSVAIYSLEAASLCAVVYYMVNGLNYLQYLPWACEYLFPYYSRPHSLRLVDTVHLVFSALRAYALSSLAGLTRSGQWSISTMVLLFSLAPLIMNCVGTMITAILTM